MLDALETSREECAWNAGAVEGGEEGCTPSVLSYDDSSSWAGTPRDTGMLDYRRQLRKEKRESEAAFHLEQQQEEQYSMELAREEAEEERQATVELERRMGCIMRQDLSPEPSAAVTLLSDDMRHALFQQLQAEEEETAAAAAATGRRATDFDLLRVAYHASPATIEECRRCCERLKTRLDEYGVGYADVTDLLPNFSTEAFYYVPKGYLTPEVPALLVFDGPRFVDAAHVLDTGAFPTLLYTLLDAAVQANTVNVLRRGVFFLCDLQDVPLSFVRTVLNLMPALLDYPVKLAKIVVFNASHLMALTLLTLARTCYPQVFGCLHVVKIEELAKYLPSPCIPSRYGGSCTAVFADCADALGTFMGERE